MVRIVFCVLYANLILIASIHHSVGVTVGSPFLK